MRTWVRSEIKTVSCNISVWDSIGVEAKTRRCRLRVILTRRVFLRRERKPQQVHRPHVCADNSPPDIEYHREITKSSKNLLELDVYI